MKIIKRNGDKVPFDPEKIIQAIKAAQVETEEIISEDLPQRIATVIEMTLNMNKKEYTVEDIQDLVVHLILAEGEETLAKSYIGYRAVRSYKRAEKSEAVLKAMTDIVNLGDNENANKNYHVPSVVRDTIAGVYFRDHLFKVLHPTISKAHRDKLIHWHDSDVDPKLSNCCIFNIKDMLDNGTRVNNADIEKPKSIQVAMNVAMQIMASISASQYGGVSLPEFNEVFAEYAKMNFVKHFKDYFSFKYGMGYGESMPISISNKLLEKEYPEVFDRAKLKTKKDIYDSCQLFEYQTNSILGSASQTPFSTITFCIPTSWESEEIISAYLDVRMRGLGKTGIPAIFPKISMTVVDGYNLKEGDKYFYLTQKGAKAITLTYYPDILMYSKENYDKGMYYGRMGCRSRVNHEYQENGEYVRMGRFNGGVVTGNLPHVALDTIKSNSKNVVEDFFIKLETTLKPVMKRALESRFNFVKTLKAKEAPILFQHGGIARLEPEETIEKLLKTDLASFSYGFIGIDDCVRILTNNTENVSTEKGFALGLRIMKAISKQAEEIKQETGLPVSLYGTPAEAGIHTMFQRDLELYGDVMPEWLKGRAYYTNSFHYSSELPIDCFSKIDLEAKLLQYANGGNISYVENSGKVQNSEAIVELIQYAYRAGTQYFAVNTVSDICFDCGFTGEIDYDLENAEYICPQCGNKDGRYMKIQRRSCGYISNFAITHAVKGRMKEMQHRAKHVGVVLCE